MVQQIIIFLAPNLFGQKLNKLGANYNYRSPTFRAFFPTLCTCYTAAVTVQSHQLRVDEISGVECAQAHSHTVTSCGGVLAHSHTVTSCDRVLVSGQRSESATLKLVEPLRLAVVLGRENTGIQEHHDDDKPATRPPSTHTTCRNARI